MSGIFLFDKNQKLFKSIGADELTQNMQEIELNGQISGTAEKAYDPEVEKATYYGVKDDENFWMYKIRVVKKEGDKIRAEGIHILFDDLKGKVIRDIRPTKTTAALALESILKGTGWDVGVSKATTVASSTYYHQTALSAFYEFLKTWDCEFVPVITFVDGKIASKKINIYDRISTDRGQWFEYGDKLVSVVAEEKRDDLCTAFIGRGRGVEVIGEDGKLTGGYGRRLKFDGIEYNKTQDGITVSKPKGQDYIEIKEATALYGYPDGSPRFGVVDFDDIEDSVVLADRTLAYALEHCRPRIQLKAQAVSNAPVEIGETVAVIGNMGIRYKTRVFKVKKDFLSGKLVNFEFGDKVVRSAAERLKGQEQKNTAKDKVLGAYIDVLIKKITSGYWNEDGYNYDLSAGNAYGLPAGYYSFNAPIDKNPTKVIYIGAGKMLIANSKDQTGQWIWRTAATADGIVANEVVGALGSYATVNAAQINVNDNFFEGSKIGEKLAEKFKAVDGKIVDLKDHAVMQDKLYSNVKITQAKGIQVLDRDNRERVQLGNWGSDRYGLKITDKTGRRTVLDDEGILQSWQDSKCDNIASGYPLRMRLYIPRETRRIYKASLCLWLDHFRSFSTGSESAGYTDTSTYDGGYNYTYSSTESGGADVVSANVESWSYGPDGHNHGLTPGYAIFGKEDDGSSKYLGSWTSSGLHTHSVTLPSHKHEFAVTVPSHRHRFTVGAHQHAISYGIYEDSSSGEYLEIFINGGDCTSMLTGSGYFNHSQTELDITSYLTVGWWNTIEIRANTLCRVDASVFIQALLQYAP